jgi:hypothetical protein
MPRRGTRMALSKEEGTEETEAGTIRTGVAVDDTETRGSMYGRR